MSEETTKTEAAPVAPAPLAPIKPGYKTTEFWLTVAAHLVNGLTLAEVFAPGSALAKVLTAVGAVFAQLGYTVMRGKAKAA